MAVIDDQGGAALAAMRRARSPTMSSAAGELGFGRPVANEAAVIADPQFRLAVILPDRQRIEEFVGDDEQRPAFESVERSSCQRAETRSAWAARSAGLVSTSSTGGAGRRRASPERVLGQRAAAGPSST